MEVGHGGDELGGEGGGGGEDFVADGQERDLRGGHVRRDVGLQPRLRRGGARGQQRDGLGLHADDELDVCVGECLHYGLLGVVDLDVAESRGHQKLRNLGRGGEVVAERAIVHPDVACRLCKVTTNLDIIKIQQLPSSYYHKSRASIVMAQQTSMQNGVDHTEWHKISNDLDQDIIKLMHAVFNVIMKMNFCVQV